MVPLEPISCSFRHPLCLFTKETQLFLCSLPSFPKETKTWIFQFLISHKVITTDSVLQCLLLGKIQKLKNSDQKWYKHKEVMTVFPYLLLFLTFLHCSHIVDMIVGYCWYVYCSWIFWCCIYNTDLHELSWRKLPDALNRDSSLKKICSILCVCIHLREFIIIPDMVQKTGFFWWKHLTIRRGLAANFRHQSPSVGLCMEGLWLQEPSHTSVQSQELCDSAGSPRLLSEMAGFQHSSVTRQLGTRQIYLYGLVKTCYVW